MAMGREDALKTSVTFVMPVRNEADHIEGAVASIQRAAEQAPGMDLEILVVDGVSDDSTAEIVKRLASVDPRIRLLDNPQRTVPHAMNIGIRAAAGDIVIRLDGHAEVEPDFIVNSLRALADHPECACVGGPIENVNQGPVSYAISSAMSSPFGVGNARFRTGGRDSYVDTLAFGAYRKADLYDVGLFDERLTRNQDDELNFRLVKAGRKIWFANDIRSRYIVRTRFDRLYKQYFQYGYWKVYVNRKHGTVTNLRQLAPPVLMAALALLTPLALFWGSARVLLALTLGAYLIGALYFTARSRPGSPRGALLVCLAFGTIHAGYGLGYLAGLRDFVLRLRQPSEGSGELSR